MFSKELFYHEIFFLRISGLAMFSMMQCFMCNQTHNGKNKIFGSMRVAFNFINLQSNAKYCATSGILNRHTRVCVRLRQFLAPRCANRSSNSRRQLLAWDWI